MRRLAVLVASLAALVSVPAAAQARTDDFSKPILLVQAPEQATPSCSTFDSIINTFPEYTTTVDGKPVGLSGDLVSIGLYANAGGCFDTLDAPRDATIEQLGAKLAAYVKSKYTAKGKPVDIVAHGGAGLVVRSALAQEPTLQIEDAVTVGTPHTGSLAVASKCGSRPVCAQLAPGSALLKGLAKNPQGAGGTDWSAIGSENDADVPTESAIGMDAAHRTVYLLDGGPTHDGLLTDTSPKDDADIQHSHGLGKWTIWKNAPHSVDRIADQLIFGVSPDEQTCGLRATKPALCGVTPVILVPGFGASQLDCTANGKLQNVWPGAATFFPYFETMALASNGRFALDGTDGCADTIKPNGHVLYDVAGGNIHGTSWAWLQSIAPGSAYEFGWDFRKGPDESLKRLDAFIDEVRAKHGVNRVALVAHSYGGLLSRWYIDDPKHAQKVARVANFGSPWWGAPKAWFAMAYGYETPAFSKLDIAVPDATFHTFAQNLTGLFYLFPPKAWFQLAPAPLRSWLDLDESPRTEPQQVIDAIGAFKGSTEIATRVLKNHEEHIDGFKRTNGVDWRIFIGSGLPTLGHVRAFSDSGNVQYSWINGDGTVPLFSQRQSATAGGDQFGDDVPTYNFCDVPHMVEMEEPALENAVAPFVATGADPIVDGRVLRDKPCTIDAVEFRVTHKEDARSLEISSLANALPAAAGARAAAAGPMTLAQAEDAGLVDAIGDGSVFVTNRDVTVRAAGSGSVQVTALKPDGARGTARVYDLDADGLEIAATGSKVSATDATGPVAGRAADKQPPRTTLKVRAGMLTVRAKDASGIAVTMVKVGKAKPRPFRKALKVKRWMIVRYWSIDTVGNVEKKRASRVG